MSNRFFRNLHVKSLSFTMNRWVRLESKLLKKQVEPFVIRSQEPHNGMKITSEPQEKLLVLTPKSLDKDTLFDHNIGLST